MRRLSRALVFGPVVSRRLGVSLGVNNIPYKRCSYTCVYCQLGRTLELTVERREYTDPRALVEQVRARLERAGRVDYVTFVPDGEPTLDKGLGRSIRMLQRELGVRVAVLTNASLLWLEEVRLDLQQADLVSLKLDAGSPATWKRINRPHPSLDYWRVLEGMRVFAGEYSGTLLTETMLVRGLNDRAEELRLIADRIAELGPSKAYIAVPTRPPAEPWVRGAGHEALATLYSELESQGVAAELLTTDEPLPPPPGTL